MAATPAPGELVVEPAGLAAKLLPCDGTSVSTNILLSYTMCVKIRQEMDAK